MNKRVQEDNPNCVLYNIQTSFNCVSDSKNVKCFYQSKNPNPSSKSLFYQIKLFIQKCAVSLCVYNLYKKLALNK